jgi:hypothetical protein
MFIFYYFNYGVYMIGREKIKHLVNVHSEHNDNLVLPFNFNEDMKIRK